MGNLVQEEKHLELHRDGNLGVLLLVCLSALGDTGPLAPWLPGLPAFRTEYLCLFFLHLLLSGLHLYLSKYIAEQESKHPKSTYCVPPLMWSSKTRQSCYHHGGGREWLEGVSRAFCFFWPYHTAGGILVPQPGIKTAPPALEVQSLNHWTIREVLILRLDLNTNMFTSGKFIKLYA